MTPTLTTVRPHWGHLNHRFGCAVLVAANVASSLGPALYCNFICFSTFFYTFEDFDLYKWWSSFLRNHGHCLCRLTINNNISWLLSTTTAWTQPYFFQYVRFFLTQIEGPRTEDVAQCADCNAHWGSEIVILGNMNIIHLNRIFTDLRHLHTVTVTELFFFVCVF